MEQGCGQDYGVQAGYTRGPQSRVGRIQGKALHGKIRAGHDMAKPAGRNLGQDSIPTVLSASSPPFFFFCVFFLPQASQPRDEPH